MSDTDENVEVRSAPMLTVPIIWRRLALCAVPLAVIALALSVWALLSASGNHPESVALPGDSKVRVCTAFELVAAMQARNELVAANASLAMLGAGDYLLRQLDTKTPQHLADAVRAFARDVQEVGMNALAGVPYSDPRQAARQAEGDFDRKQVADLCQ
ncbi:hypothetical protein ACTXG7_22475 [Mycolicibacterium sp. Dal123E01]|uniref:hypothetical protein n=1 Tax=Mycolicibacterium sp. Dal123E01 TaxID=3457578 RepID=UPI00403EDEE5